MDRQLHREIGKHLPRRKRNRERERWSTRACRPPPPRRHSVSALKSSPLLILPPPPTLRSSLYLRSPFVPDMILIRDGLMPMKCCIIKQTLMGISPTTLVKKVFKGLIKITTTISS
ncbi:hypothetical protein I3760_08G090500 [Carya illinoinensis]|nr:hypothetical protein I3760_08G090500 [Carya illinoinensis]